MTPDELRAALADLGLTGRAFARRIAVHEQSVTRWVKGTRPVPSWIPSMIEMMRKEQQ